MSHTKILPEAAKDEQKIAQCIRYIKLQSCVLIMIAALCITNIGVLSWHIIRAVPCQDEVITQKEFNAETEKSEAREETIKSLQLDLDQETQEIIERLDALESAVKLISENCSADIVQLQIEVKKQQKEIVGVETKLEANDTGSTFTRWGRPDCPENGTELVYAGYVGGGNHTHSGAAVNYLCLTKKPTWDHTTNIDNDVYNNAYLYGAEYQFSSELSTKYFGQNLFELEPPCAVCRSTRTSVIMIPGTNVCTEGWVREYAGYLVAGGATHTAASEYICLDSNVTTTDGSNVANQNGKLMYLVKAECGSLKCPPYVTGREVTCVVCTR